MSPSFRFTALVVWYQPLRFTSLCRIPCVPASRFIPAAALRTSARLSRDQSFRRFSSVRQEVWLSQNTHVVFSGESAFVNASNGLSNQPFFVGGT